MRPTQQGLRPQQAVWKPAHPGAVITVYPGISTTSPSLIATYVTGKKIVDQSAARAAVSEVISAQ